MGFVFTDRESSYPNRYMVTPETGSPYYVVLERADEPITPGTPLNAETFNNVFAEKAPEGFGLGKAKRITFEELDTTCAPGWYYISNEAQEIGGISVSYWYVHVVAYSNGLSHAMQYLYPVRVNGMNRLRRMCHNKVWGEWEHESPPMVLGVEYRTIERYKGEPVYTQLVDCGTVPETSTGNDPSADTGGGGSGANPDLEPTEGTVVEDVWMKEIVRYSGTMTSSTATLALPYMSLFADSGLVGTMLNVKSVARDNVNIVVVSNDSSHVGNQVYCQIWYTKLD